VVETSARSQTSGVDPGVDPRDADTLSAPPRTDATDHRWFRSDVDGIRAIAIALVVAYHAKVPHLHGGFIGVDVFFVISGFLISRNLLRERDSSGRIALGRFWARRVRRLVPALALVVAVTLVGAYFILPLYALGDVAKQGAAASLYVSNLLFASQARDYFAADVSSSPFLHTWSLGVEEQFYLVWPVLVALAAWLTLRRRATADAGRRDRRALVLAFFGVTFVVSMALNLSLTASGSTWAFFSLPSRAWEFAVAGLLAALPTPRLLRHVRARTVLAVAGLVVLAVALKVLDDATAYPGLWALLPVTATVLLIMAGDTFGGEAEANVVSRGLSLRPMQWLGRVSYSWYLWHWPAIVLLVVALDRDTTTVRSVAALATLPVAWAAYRWFETPLRFSPLIARSNLRTFAFGAVVTVAVVVLAGAVRPDSISRTNRGDTLTAADFEAAPGASLEERVAVTVDELRKHADEDCPKDALKTDDGDAYCVAGDTTSSRTLLLLGDSHAGQWRRPLDQIAKAAHVKLLIRQHNGCPPYAVDVTDPNKPQKVATCRHELERDLPVIDALQPDAVLIATWSGNRDHFVDDDGDALSDADQVAAWKAGVTTTWGALTQRGIPFGVILDEPDLPVDPMKCIAKENSVEACQGSAASDLAASKPLLDAERQVLATMPDVPFIDLTSVICTDRGCALEMDGTFVYADTHHLTDAFVLKHQDLLEPLVARLVG
jgi:peptidoglycan/LPS O-acetylase OafA/YrhL